MSSEKQKTSESYSEEIDQQVKKPDDTTGVGRSYECSFCKRGFTNAQALGGHMNIHRKDKGKAKRKLGLDYNYSPKDEDLASSTQKFFSPNLGDQHQHHHQRLYSSYMRCQLYFPGSNPGYNLHACDRRFDFGSMRKDHRTLYEYRRTDQNLSLRIGSSHLEDHVGVIGGRENNKIEADIDLELRLGQHP